MPELNEAEKPKFIVEYQITDEQGQPLIDPHTGKPMFTNFTGNTPEEVFEKQKQAHINATRAQFKLRNQRPVPKETPAAPRQMTAEEERQAALDLQDPAKAREAARKLTGVDQIEEENKKTREMQDKAASDRAVYQFLSAHVTDYFPCQANSKIMSDYIAAENLDPRVAANYEIAFEAVQARLAQRPAPATPTPNEVPPEPPKKQAASGIQPGQLSGQRPTIQKKKSSVTKEDIKRMRATPEGRAEYAKRMRDPQFVADVDALFAPH